MQLFKRRTLEHLAMRDNWIGRQLRRLLTRNLEQAREHILLLVQKTATERVIDFLVEMDRRLGSAEVQEELASGGDFLPASTDLPRLIDHVLVVPCEIYGGSMSQRSSWSVTDLKPKPGLVPLVPGCCFR
jgi:CRP-like cAMP-binding protein